MVPIEIERRAIAQNCNVFRLLYEDGRVLWVTENDYDESLHGGYTLLTRYSADTRHVMTGRAK